MVNITERPCFGWGGGRGGAGRRGREGKGEGAACLLRHRLSQRSAHVEPQPAATQRGIISTVATRGAARCCMHRGDRISTKVFG